MKKKMYSVLPKRFRANISKIKYYIKDGPKVLLNENVNAVFPGKAKGGVIISADFELGWAVRFSKESKDPDKYSFLERKNLPVIIKHLNDFQIPIVWAIVGHLFLKTCNRGDHDWMKRIPYFNDHWNYTEGDWFDCDPHTNYKKDPSWYAPDLIETILNSKVQHEIACHTFSHIDCSYKNCPPEVLEDELTASFNAAKSWGIKFKSITFPGGTAGNFEVLKKFGISICRKRHLDYEIAYPFLNNKGIIVTPTGPGIALKYRDYWSIDYIFSRIKKVIDKAILTNTIAHLWFHPSQEEETFSDLFPMILEYCADQREKNNLWVGTMNEMTEFIQNNQIILDLVE